MTINDLEETAKKIRISIIESLLNSGSGHTAGSLSMTDVFTALYFNIIKHDPKNPEWQERDRVILSNGHICPVQYATLAEAGYFPKSELDLIRRIDSKLQGHPHLNQKMGIENSSGPLGQGLSQAAGIAYAFKVDQLRNHVYCVMSDGEQQEGQTWEAYMFAAKYHLSNLTVLIDRNNIQIGGYTEDIMPIEPFKNKLESFGWYVIDIDGHNIEEVIDSCNQAKSIQQQSVAIICNTTAGKGVEFMENLPSWHGKTPDLAESIDAIEDLRTLKGQISYE